MSYVNRVSPNVYRIPITKARVNLGQVVRRAHLDKECFILEKDGIPLAGIIDIDELEHYLEFRDPKLRTQVRASYRAYRHGKAKPLDHLLAELKPHTRKQHR
ncbi:MAG: type II toxin-antitoxin system Phd/YefM family antitoxin [Candidatus Hydrogenedentes bacterium]|nr:type II toxin-antitoxin system Phd/YefM family antitoxin [Candidatus Hydrogenedentota bacterium]